VEPISLIIAALAAGAVAGARDTAGAAVKDVYGGLKALIRRRFGGNREASAALDLSECQPAAPPGELARYLWAVGAETDEELIAAAQAVLRLVDPAGARTGKYEVTISGGKGIVVGDQANVTMTFNDGD
jgi:hypothetical protein